MQLYRRGVASDALPFSRPLPLCGIAQGAVRAIRLDAPSLVLPRGAAGRTGNNDHLRGARPLGAPPTRTI